MSRIDPPVGEDDLQAYFDGRLAADRRATVERYLNDHPTAADDLARDGAALAELRSRLAFKAAEPIPARLRVSSIRAGLRGQRLARLRSVAAVCAWLALGGIGGWLASGLLASPQPEPVRVARMADDAIAAYRTFVVEVVHPVEVRADEQAHLVGWLSKRLRTPIDVPDLTSLGYRLMGGRLLPGHTGPAAMLMYDDDAGTRLTLYVKTDEIEETAFQFVEKDGVSAFLWRDRGLGYVVSAATPREALMPIARLVHDELERRPGAAPPNQL
ncbi:MAG: anti-sigma factor [Aurantimonas endophytica]|uniref:Anti-sigma factor RsiW n=1 Tax=Aurantimonas endophytica TaxID=1522175 RepID=A0A7W6HI43_9HYPH|nr:anti-sigma factor [Aurantimonas endophytica]MBB4005367.1 anti-sigma factor RsiW [Aurantimonas endophytica]MCO6405972.1 anti-sigma factor [Aurantimonas endophytica]